MTNSLAERFFDFDLWLVGGAHFVILFASFQVPYRLRWKQDLQQLMPFNRKLLWVQSGFTVLTIIVFGVLTLVLHSELLRGDRAAGTRLLYRDLLDGANPCGRTLFFPRRLAEGNGIHPRTCPPDVSLFRACRKLSRAIHMASVDERRRIDMRPTRANTSRNRFSGYRAESAFRAPRPICTI